MWQDLAWTGAVTARVNPETRRIDMSTSSPNDDSFLMLSYADGTGSWNWNLDLSGMLEIHFDVAGDISPAQPLYVDVTLYDQDPAIAGENAYGTITVTQPGTVVLPFSAFTRSASFDPTTVDEILFFFMNCPESTCTEPNLPRRYTIGPITLTGDLATPARRTTWGALKHLYR